MAEWPGWDALIAGTSLAGHVGLWAGLFNRIHATALPEWAIKLLSLACHAALVFLACEFGWWLLSGGSWLAPLDDGWDAVLFVRRVYAALCLGVLVGPLRRWAYHQFFAPTSEALTENHTTVVDIGQTLAAPPIRGLVTHVLARVPWNEFLKLHVQHKSLMLPSLPRELDGLTITHLSDLHCCGRLTKDFFVEVIRQANALRADLVALTGDYFDDRACLEWVDDTLGRLTAPLGVYFVLGNHDLYIGDVSATRRRLTDAGLIDLGGRWTTIAARGRSIVLAGNELPWHVPAADMEACPRHANGTRALRVLLSHTPDQFEWARRWDFDLMLAGHTHGGQVRLPLVGPIFVPSRIEVRYSAGAFHEPPTVMHVSRGVSGKTPLRINCPPELSLLTLRTSK